MPGPMPKDPKLRQRTNKATTRATFVVNKPKRRRMPPLPDRLEGRGWHNLTLAWWKDTWTSPLATEYITVDIHALYRLAALIDMFWTSPTKEIAAEITKEQQGFGQTPLDRRRLEWTVEQAEQAKERRSKRVTAKAPITADDPRKFLQVVS